MNKGALMRVRERGLALIFSLLALVALTLGAVALVRSVDLNLLAIGNLTAKQTGVAASAQGAEMAMTWIEGRRAAGVATLDANLPEQGYYAVALDALDPTGGSVAQGANPQLVDWDANGCRVDGEAVANDGCFTPRKAGAIAGEEVSYLITRMCPDLGTETKACLRPPFDGVAKVSGAKDSEAAAAGDEEVVTTSAYFRILVRTRNARGTVAYTETLVHY